MADRKYTKEEVNYRNGSGRKRCFLCEHFSQPNKCEIVEGSVKADAVCDRFERTK